MDFANIFVGDWALIALNSINIPAQISNLSSQLESFDTSLVKTAGLQEPVSNLEQSALEQLNLFADYSEIPQHNPGIFHNYGSTILGNCTKLTLLFPIQKNQ